MKESVSLKDKGIYCITINNKYYIGQTMVSFNHRKQHHFRSLKRGTHGNPHLQSAYNKYKQFKFDILQPCNTLDECNKAEIEWISIYNSLNNRKGYNLNQGGRNGTLSDESKLKMSLAKLGKRCSDDTKQKMSQSHHKNNKNKQSGYSGICWLKRRSRWRIRMYINGKRKVMGYFINLEDAISCYNNIREVE